jgi:hypothetical protein
MLYRVLALDPGGTTGWSSYTAERMAGPGYEAGAADVAWEYYDEQWACGQIGPEEHHLTLYELLGFQQVQEFTVVCESFEFRSMDKRDRNNINLMSREYIGVTKLFAQERMLDQSQNLIFQTAGKAKGFIPDSGPMANKKIKDAGLWYPNSKHAMDATRHLLWYLVNRENRMDLVERWWKPSS